MALGKIWTRTIGRWNEMGRNRLIISMICAVIMFCIIGIVVNKNTELQVELRFEKEKITHTEELCKISNDYVNMIDNKTTTMMNWYINNNYPSKIKSICGDN